MAYDLGFFETIRDGCRSSAAAVVPTIVKHFHPRMVVDVGCGEGWWAREFTNWGADAVGVDGPGTRTVLDRFIAHDLTQPLPANLLAEPFDLALSLEVAEHLPAMRAAGFIADLCACADVVVFSAAIPGQGGTGHVNEQWPQVWEDLFHHNGFAVSGALRWAFWNDPTVENWYRQNLLIAARRPQEYPELFATPLAQVFAVVHPVLYDARRAR